MRKHLTLFTTCLLMVAEAATAQVMLNFDAGNAVTVSGDDYYSAYLKENVYAADDGYYAQLLQNPFFSQMTGENATTPLALQPMNSGVPMRDNYFGLATWATTAAFDNVEVTAADGTVLYSDSFTNTGDEWNQNGGSWSVENGTLRQTNESDLGSLNVCYRRTGHDGTLRLDATKLSGAEGFLIAFSYVDNENYCWWNIGGWNNTQHAIEQCIGGVKTTLATAAGSITTGQTYALKVVMEGEHVRCYIDGRLIHDIVLTSASSLYGSATVSDDGSRVWVRMANPTAQNQQVVVRLKDADVQYASLTRKSVSKAFSPEVLNSVTATSTTRTTLTPVMDGAVAAELRPLSLNTVELTVDDVPIATGIGEIHNESDEAAMKSEPLSDSFLFGEAYDLQGRRVVNPQLEKGIYIVGGRKVMVR